MLEMNKLIIDFENCYGIKKLEKEFDFLKTPEKKLFVIYAPNGAMKTSFAKTFQDLSKNEPSRDRVFKERVTRRSIKDGSGNEVDGDHVFVIEPYRQDFKSAKISTLLVNEKLKEEYDQTYADIDEKKETLISELKVSSGIKKETEETLATDIESDRNEFFKSLVYVVRPFWTRFQDLSLHFDRGLGRG